MRSLLYWIGSTLLIIALIALVWGVGFAVQESRWPFARVWGAVFVALGVSIAVWAYVRRNVSPPFLMPFGVALALGGIGYAIVGLPGPLVAAFGFAVREVRRNIDPPPN